MDIDNLNLDQLAKDLDSQCQAVSSSADLDLIKRDWLGKEGSIKLLLKQLSKLSQEERPRVAAELNKLKAKLEDFLKNKQLFFEKEGIAERLKSEYIDLSLPSRSAGRGAIHPISVIERKVSAILRPFGLKVVYGPEIETEYFCFDSLNIPKHHPARDMQDTFYTNTGHLLRTHTSSVQTRTLVKKGFPIKILSPGRVYRNETIDASHQAMFHQYELMWIDKNLTLSNLMGLLALVAKELYGKRRKIRFKPKYYPYTEPSIGLDVACAICKGEGCSFCGDSGWATVVGAGMVHRNVLTEFGYDAEEVSGIAFGFGTTRLAAQHFGLPRGKMLYENDLRVLKSL